MISLFIVALLCGDCNRVVVRQAYVAPVKAVAVVAPAYNYNYAAAVVVDPYFAYAVSDRYQSEARLQKLETVALQQAELLQAIRQGQTAAGSSSTAAEPVASHQAALGLLQKSCISCHAGAAAKGGIDLTKPLTTPQKLLIEEVVRTGAMPPKPAKEFTDAEYAEIQSWARSDKDGVRAALRASK